MQKNKYLRGICVEEAAALVHASDYSRTKYTHADTLNVNEVKQTGIKNKIMQTANAN